MLYTLHTALVALAGFGGSLFLVNLLTIACGDKARARKVFAVWILAFVHGLTAGTDTGSAWALAMYLGAASLVGGLTASRFVSPEARRPAVR